MLMNRKRTVVFFIIVVSVTLFLYFKYLKHKIFVECAYNQINLDFMIECFNMRSDVSIERISSNTIDILGSIDSEASYSRDLFSKNSIIFLKPFENVEFNRPCHECFYFADIQNHPKNEIKCNTHGNSHDILNPVIWDDPLEWIFMKLMKYKIFKEPKLMQNKNL